MGVTIRHVARRAGVSIASVSRVLNGTGKVNERIHARVMRAAKELNYVPHESARSLITRQTRTIGVLLPDLHGEFFGELLRGLDKEARDRGLYLLVTSSHGNEAEVGRALRAMHGRVDGALVMSPFALQASLIDESLPAGLPVLLLNAPESVKARSVIAVDNFGGARAAVEHLRAQGCRDIVHIAGPADNYDAKERLRGFLAAMQDAEPRARRTGGGAREARIAESGLEGRVFPGDFTEEAGYRVGRQLAARRKPPDAVFAANDIAAVGCLLALRSAGIRVPVDVALVGFDDVPLTRYTSPPLTSVRVHMDVLAKRAFEMLDARIAATDQKGSEQRQHSLGGASERVIVPTELVIRRSSEWRISGGAPV